MEEIPRGEAQVSPTSTWEDECSKWVIPPGTYIYSRYKAAGTHWSSDAHRYCRHTEKERYLKVSTSHLDHFCTHHPDTSWPRDLLADALVFFKLHNTWEVYICPSPDCLCWFPDNASLVLHLVHEHHHWLFLPSNPTEGQQFAKDLRDTLPLRSEDANSNRFKLLTELSKGFELLLESQKRYLFPVLSDGCLRELVAEASEDDKSLSCFIKLIQDMHDFVKTEASQIEKLEGSADGDVNWTKRTCLDAVSISDGSDYFVLDDRCWEGEEGIGPWLVKGPLFPTIKQAPAAASAILQLAKSKAKSISECLGIVCMQPDFETVRLTTLLGLWNMGQPSELAASSELDPATADRIQPSSFRSVIPSSKRKRIPSDSEMIQHHLELIKLTFELQFLGSQACRLCAVDLRMYILPLLRSFLRMKLYVFMKRDRAFQVSPCTSRDAEISRLALADVKDSDYDSDADLLKSILLAAATKSKTEDAATKLKTEPQCQDSSQFTCFFFEDLNMSSDEECLSDSEDKSEDKSEDMSEDKSEDMSEDKSEDMSEDKSEDTSEDWDPTEDGYPTLSENKKFLREMKAWETKDTGFFVRMKITDVVKHCLETSGLHDARDIWEWRTNRTSAYWRCFFCNMRFPDVKSHMVHIESAHLLDLPWYHCNLVSSQVVQDLVRVDDSVKVDHNYRTFLVEAAKFKTPCKNEEQEELQLHILFENIVQDIQRRLLHLKDLTDAKRRPCYIFERVKLDAAIVKEFHQIRTRKLELSHLCVCDFKNDILASIKAFLLHKNLLDVELSSWACKKLVEVLPSVRCPYLPDSFFTKLESAGKVTVNIEKYNGEFGFAYSGLSWKFGGEVPIDRIKEIKGSYEFTGVSDPAGSFIFDHGVVLENIEETSKIFRMKMRIGLNFELDLQDKLLQFQADFKRRLPDKDTGKLLKEKNVF